MNRFMARRATADGTIAGREIGDEHATPHEKLQTDAVVCRPHVTYVVETYGRVEGSNLSSLMEHKYDANQWPLKHQWPAPDRSN